MLLLNMIYPRAMCTALYTARWSLFMTISFLIMPTSPQQPAAARTAAPGFPALARQLSTEPGHTFTKLSLSRL